MTSFLTVVGLASVLWFVVFPVIEPKMPFNNGQLDGAEQETTSQPADPATTSEDPSGTATAEVSSSESALAGD